MRAERLARLIVIVLAAGVPLVAAVVDEPGPASGQTVELRGRMAETGGWTPADLTAEVGQPLHLRLTSDDVMHGFAVGQTDWPTFDVKPGEVTETTLVFDRPGKYTFYCTRWCGPNHWRMRGSIQVSGNQNSEPPAVEQALYVTLGIDIDAPHRADRVPFETPSAERGAALDLALPAAYLDTDYYRSHAPLEVWTALRAERFARDLSDGQVWDLVALAWRRNTTPEAIALGRRVYAANCAACHGETGAGDGVMAESLKAALHSDEMDRHDTTAPADFTDAASMLGASPALLGGKITRGGMGTGMPYFGPIFTDEQLWAVVDFVWTFQFK